MSRPPSSTSKPSPPGTQGDRRGGGGSISDNPSAPRSPDRHPRRRATHEPSALHSYIVATKIQSDRCVTRSNSIRFRPDRDGDDYLDRSAYDADDDAFASVAGGGGRMGDMDSGSLVSYNSCSSVCFGDRQVANSLFQVANHGGDDDAASRRGGDDNAGSNHWREASRVAMSFDTAEKAAETLSRYRERSRTKRGGSFDEGFLPSALDAEPHRSDDEESGIFIYGSDQRRAPSSGLVTTQEMPPEDDRSATSSVLWNHIDQSYHSHRRNRRSTAPPASCREGKRLRKSAMHVARRVARGVAGVLVLVAILLYIAFEVDLESIEENIMERFSDNDNRGENEEEAVAPSKMLRSRKLPQEQVPAKKPVTFPREDQEATEAKPLGTQRKRARERRESLRRTSLQ